MGNISVPFLAAYIMKKTVNICEVWIQFFFPAILIYSPRNFLRRPSHRIRV